jgi:two-component system chemotaxis response regulator CheY
MKVIIADDSLTMRRVLSNMLEEMGQGFDCLTADGGDVVLELLDEHPDVGLILLDWNMNVMNGLDCLRAIRARAETQAIPVVMISAETMRDRIVETVKAGANSYIIKPFTPEKLQAIITPLLRQ